MVEDRSVVRPSELHDAVASRIAAAGGRVDYVEVGCILVHCSLKFVVLQCTCRI